jgi:hypothetical protein
MADYTDPTAIDISQISQEIERADEIVEVLRLETCPRKNARGEFKAFVVLIVKGCVLAPTVLWWAPIFEAELIGTQHDIAASAEVKAVVVHAVHAQASRLRFAKVILSSVLVNGEHPWPTALRCLALWAKQPSCNTLPRLNHVCHQCAAIFIVLVCGAKGSLKRHAAGKATEPRKDRFA